MAEKKPYKKPEIVNLSVMQANIIKANQKVIESLSSIGSIIQGHAKEIKSLRDRVDKLEKANGGDTLDTAASDNSSKR